MMTSATLAAHNTVLRKAGSYCYLPTAKKSRTFLKVALILVSFRGFA